MVDLCDKFIGTMPLLILTSKDKPLHFDWERVLDTYPYPPHDKAGVENYMLYLNEIVQTELDVLQLEFEHSSAHNSFFVGAGINLYADLPDLQVDVTLHTPSIPAIFLVPHRTGESIWMMPSPKPRHFFGNDKLWTA